MLYGGAAGGGKSLGLLVEGLVHCLENPGAHAILLRRIYSELERTLILVSLRLFPRSICRYNEVKHRWIIRPQGANTDSILEFGHLRHERDVYEYQGAEFSFIGFDELTHFTWPMFEYLVGSRLRSSLGIRCRVRCASNPGNVGHAWVKKFFGIGRVAPETVFTPEPDGLDQHPMSRCFIPAKLADNPHLNDKDPGYMKRLMMMDPVTRKMLMDGDWEQYEGQFFSEISPKHFVEPFVAPKSWKVYRSVDYGYAKPFACLWVAVAPDGHYYVIREAYQTGLKDRDQAVLIRSMSPEPVEYTTGDPSMHTKNSTGSSAAQAYLAAADIALVPGNNSRVPGWMAVRNLLALHPDGKPVLQIFSTCHNLKRELESAVYSSEKQEDLDTDCSDHALDALRYLAVSRPAVVDEVEPDPYAGMDPSTAREWRAVHALQRKVAERPDAAVLSGFNHEDEKGEEEDRGWPVWD